MNTLSTYLLYLVLLAFLPYQISYALAFFAGIFIAYFMNRLFVFNSHRGASSLLLLPLVYLVQYLISAGIIHTWVELSGQSEHLAPLIAVVITVPVTFLLSRMIFVKAD